MKRLLLSGLSIIMFGAFVFAQSPETVRAYIDRYKSTALQNEREYGIPAPIILAQGILESGAGTSGLTRASNNHFGIKAGSRWSGRVYRAWDDETVKSQFRCYDSAAESYHDHAVLLTTTACYKPLFKINVYDYRGWAFGLKRANYATAPDYAQALIGIIDHYKLYEINGGAKLKPGKTVIITRYVDIEQPVFEQECIMADDEETEEQSMIAAAVRKFAVMINNVRCTVLQPGETLASIARKYDISPRELLAYNEISSDAKLKEGDIVFLDKKKKKFEGAQDFYVVADSETLYDVAQKFGIQLHSLAQMNRLNDYARLVPATRIYLK